MAEFKPALVEYLLTVANHTMCARVEHLELARRFSFLFDDRLVSEKVLPAGDFLTDDDCIEELVDNYCRTQKGVYSDILRRHSDKVNLISKTVKFSLINFGIVFDVQVVVKGDLYQISMSGNNDADTLTASFHAQNFSEVLEKVRLFTNYMGEANTNLSMNITQLSNDKIQQWFKWVE